MTNHAQSDKTIFIDKPRFAKPSALFAKLHQSAPTLAKKLSLVYGSTALTTQSALVGLPLFTCGSIKVLGNQLGIKNRVTKAADKAIVDIADFWVGANNRRLDKLIPNKDWRITLPANLSPNKNYLLICNHQSWVDTSIIQYVSEGVLPLTRFFIKHELVYIPIVGQAFYLLDFPMMKRYSKEKLAKNPNLAGKDLEEAKRACSLLLDKEFVLLNYLEGTRFNPKKHQAQNSPYRHLLKPKAGGLALAIASLGDKIDGILDMTVVYPDGVPEYGDLWAGKLTRLGVEINELVMDDGLLSQLKNGEYQTNADVKEQLHAYLDWVWQQKDRQIDKILSEFD